MRAGALAALCTCLALAIAPGPSVAATPQGNVGNSFNELTKASEEAPTQTQTTKRAVSGTSESSSSNGHTVIWAGIGVAVVLLCFIAFFIARDARRVAPAGDADIIEARSGHDAAVRLRKRRAKARAARKQRKRNR